MNGAQIKNVLVLGDSITFSRRHKRQRLEDSWPYLFHQDSGAFVLMRGEGAATTKSLLRQLHMLSTYYAANEDRTFTHAVVQIGIVDCCPRILPPVVSQLFDRVPGGTKFAKLLEKPLKKLGVQGRPIISPAAFRRNIQAILSQLESLTDCVVLLAIAPAINYLPLNAPGVEERIRQYNEIMREVIQERAGNRPDGILFCDPWGEKTLASGEKALDDLILEDGYHLTADGHRWVATHLLEELQRHTGVAGTAQANADISKR